MKRTKKLCRASDRTENIQDFGEFEEELNDDGEGGFRLDDDIVIPAPQPVIQADTRYGLPRIIITHIVNENFKSYFGKVVVGPFHKSFSCVVGPNGSGKSNVIDSIMFVFGYRSSRIRSKDLRSLIHKSKHHSDIDKCTVEVHFIQIQDTESGHYTIVPDSKFSVSRTISKDGTSFYKINDNKVTFKEVTKHLRVYGIDLIYNRFLILQGEVEKISLMKPKKINETDAVGMLEFIEDIIGTARYKEPLRKLNDKLRAFQEKRHIQLDQVKRVKGELNMLKEPMLVVVDYLKTKNKISQLNNMKFQYIKYQAEREMNQKQSKKEELENALKQDEETAKQLSSRRIEYDKALRQMRKDVDRLTVKCETERTSRNEAQRTLEDLEKQLPDLESQEKRLLQDHSNAQTELQKLEKTVDKNKAQIDENNKKLTEITQQIIKFEENVRIAEAAYLEEVQAYEDVRDKHANLRTKAKLECLSKDTAYATAVSEYNSIKKSFEEESNLLEKLKQRYKTKIEERKMKQEQLRKLADEQVEKSAELKEFEQDLSVCENNLSEKLLPVENLRGQLKHQENARSAVNLSNRVLRYIMNCKLPGIIGRLGDLGAIDSKYDVAISMSCGLLDSVVVDTTETSSQCINLLKRDNVGQSGFIALDKLQDMSRSMQNKPNVRDALRLFDLIRIKFEKVRPAFYHGLHDTLVVDNIDIGSKIAYGSKRYRVVSLKGEIIETTGSMTGSGKERPRSGKMGTAIPVAVEDTTKLNAELNQAEETLSFVRNERNRYISLISSHQSRLSKIKLEMQRLDSDIQRLSIEIPESATEIARVSKKLEKLFPDPSVLAEKHEKVTAAEKDLEEIKNRINAYEEKIKDTENRIKATRENVMKNSETLLNQARANERSISSANGILDNEMRTFKRKIDVLRDKVGAKDEIMQDIQKKKEKVQREKAALDKRLEGLNNALREYEKRLNEDVRSVQEKEIILRDTKNEQNTLSREMSNRQKERETIITDLANLRRNLIECGNQIVNLKLEVVPDISDIPVNGTSAQGDTSNSDSNAEDQLPTYTVEEMETFVLSRLTNSIRQKTEHFNSLKPNLSIVSNFSNVRKRLLDENDKLQRINEKCNQYVVWQDETKRKRISEFKAGFTVIANKVKMFYQMLTTGGDADLELKDSLNPFSDGIQLSVRPPKKSWKTIDKLSGGEKTLASLTIVFALHDYRPTPFYFMDEIDAALDEVNSCIIGHYIKMQTRMAQFIVISLRWPMFSLAPRLVGIYKVDDCTNSVTIRNKGHDRSPTKISVKEQVERIIDGPQDERVSDDYDDAFC